MWDEGRARWKDEVKKERKGREDAGIDGFVMLGFSTALDSHGVGGEGRRDRQRSRGM